MAACRFALEAGQAEAAGRPRPKVVSKAYQVFECSWLMELEGAGADRARIGQLDGVEPPYRDFNGVTSRFGCHFILAIDRILMQERFHDAIIDGLKAGAFPRVPVDYGYRDSANFWYTRFRRPTKEKVPAGKEADLGAVMFAANRVDPEVKFTEDAGRLLVKVPKVFLKTALRGCVDWAKANGVSLIDAGHMATINDKRAAEKAGV